MVPTLTVATLALLIVLAGCSTGPAGGGPETSPTTSPTTTFDGPPDATRGNTLVYADLTATQRGAFEAAVDEEARCLGESIHESPHVQGEYFDPAVCRSFGTDEYVRKNGSYYEISTQMGGVIADYNLHAFETDAPPNGTVVPLTNLSDRTREPVRRAVENGSYRVPWGKWSALPGELQGRVYVRHSGTVYGIGISVGDAWITVLTAG